MRRIFKLLPVLLITTSVLAQAPEKMSYQAVIRDANGNLVVNTNAGMRIQILQTSEFGAAVYVETHSPTTNANGLITLEIGNGDVVLGNFSDINWANGPYFLKTETDPTGGTDYTIVGTSQVLSVPYAFYAKTADSLNGGINETDPMFGSSVAGAITSTDTSMWNNKSNFSGNYNDLANKPNIADSISKNVDGSETKITAGTNVNITGNGTVTDPYGINNTGHYIGELYGGGIIVAVWKQAGVEHGLIASLTDINTVTEWSNVTTALIGISAQSPFDGQANTDAIIAQNGHTSSAAKLCADYLEGDFNDWYLPAVWELNQCYNAALVVNTILGATDGFKFDRYWSSTEYNSDQVYFQYFTQGWTNYDVKYGVHRVRAVRRF